MSAHSGAGMADANEQALIARAQRGEHAAYEELLQPALRPATRLAYSMLRDRTEAEDAFQDAALRAWRRLGNLRAGSRFQPWFIGIVANQCREARRGRWWHVVRVADVAPPGPPSGASWIEGEDLRRAMEQLPDDQRLAVFMHFHLDMPLADVALALGISVPGVKSRINRALKRLRPALSVSEVPING